MTAPSVTPSARASSALATSATRLTDMVSSVRASVFASAQTWTEWWLQITWPATVRPSRQWTRQVSPSMLA